MESKYIRKIIFFSTQLYIGWVLFIAILTLLPGKYLSGINWNFLSIDKSIHFTVFFVLSLIGALNYKKRTWIKGALAAAIISFVVAVLYGSFLEYCQTFIPKRGFDYADLTANAIGALSGMVLFLLINKKLKD